MAQRSPAITPDLPDAEAIDRARKGDHEAYRVLVERYQGRAFRLALRVLGDPDRAQDAVQDGFLKAYRSLDKFEGRSGFYTWLYRLVFNVCIDLKRRDRSNRHVEWNDEVATERSAAAPEGGAPSELGDPWRELRRGELREALAKAVASLPEDARRTLLMREVDGLSYSAIAEALEVPKGTVMSRLHHARRRVREQLMQAGIVDSDGALDVGGVA